MKKKWTAKGSSYGGNEWDLLLFVYVTKEIKNKGYDDRKEKSCRQGKVKPKSKTFV